MIYYNATSFGIGKIIHGRESMAEAPLSEKVYDWLMTSLLTQRLKPGDRLNRRQVAEEVGVSSAPALEAMLLLEAEGFLETVPRQGTLVRQIDAEEVRGQWLLREALEAQAARLYCGQPVVGQKVKLLRLARSADTSDPHTIQNWRAEIRFHRALIQLAGSTVLLDAFDRVMRHSLFHAVNELLPPPPKKCVSDSHQQLLAQLQTPNAEKADRIIRRHIQVRIQAAEKPPADS